MRTFHVANFGCRSSQSEGAAIEQELLGSSACETSSLYASDVVIINSCTVTEEADREVRQTIRRIATRNPQARIIVTGCYAQRAPEELASLPHVRYVAGNSHKPIVGQLALRAFDEDEHNLPGRAEIFCSSIFQERELRGAVHSGSAGRTRAVVKVQDGCNANCSFCIIPSVRGRSRSMDPARVVENVQTLVDRGYKEVVFSGIHLGSYGRDLSPRTSLVELVANTLDDVGELERLRLSSIEPLEVTCELIDFVGRHPRMAHHFHVPLQSGSRRVLREMRRPYAPEYYADLVSRIRSSIDDAAVGADVMVGFPGETDREFAETYELIETSPLTYLHVFPYSARPGTPAADMPHRVPRHVSRARANALREMIGRKNQDFRRSMIGRFLDVLVLQTGEGLSTNFIRSRVPSDLPANEWVKLQVTGLDEDGLAASKTTTAQDIN